MITVKVHDDRLIAKIRARILSRDRSTILPMSRSLDKFLKKEHSCVRKKIRLAMHELETIERSRENGQFSRGRFALMPESSRLPPPLPEVTEELA